MEREFLVIPEEDVRDVQSFRDEPPFLSTTFDVKDMGLPVFLVLCNKHQCGVPFKSFTIKDTIGSFLHGRGRMRCSLKKYVDGKKFG